MADQWSIVGTAADRAAKRLADVPRDSKDESVLRDVAFDLLRAWQRERIMYHLRSADEPQDHPFEWSDALHADADALSIYTADNLAVLIGSDHEDAAFDELGSEAVAGIDSIGKLVERLAYYANFADLSAELERLKKDEPERFGGQTGHDADRGEDPCDREEVVD